MPRPLTNVILFSSLAVACLLGCQSGGGSAPAGEAAAPMENATRHADMDEKACKSRNRPPRMFTIKAELKSSADSDALKEKGKAAGCVSGGNESFPPDKTTYANIFCCP